MPKIHMINISKDFSIYPAGRYKSDGPYTGQHLREDFLLPALKEPGATVEINMDGARGYPASFLQEGFGQLVEAGYGKEELEERLLLKAADKEVVAKVWDLISEVDDSLNRSKS